MGVTLQMQQEKALKILSEHLQHFADEYGVKKIGVFPYSDAANRDCKRGQCCGYHPQIGVAVEYKPEAKPSLFDLGGLLMHITELFECDVVLETIGVDGDQRYQQSEDHLQDVVYAR